VDTDNSNKGHFLISLTSNNQHIQKLSYEHAARIILRQRHGLGEDAQIPAQSKDIGAELQGLSNPIHEYDDAMLSLVGMEKIEKEVEIYKNIDHQ
jgi:hypothetical protein